VRQPQHLEAETKVRVRDLGAVKDSRGRVRRPVVGEDDLTRDLAVAKELGASLEAFLDATRLVIGR